MKKLYRVATMSRILSHNVSENSEGLRLDSYLSAEQMYASRNAAARAIESNLVFVNGKNVQKKYIVMPGDLIVYELEDLGNSRALASTKIPLDIRFEDEDMLVLSKQADLVCHPSNDEESSTLVNALVNHCGIENLCNVQGDMDRPGIVHRLDKNTSGLMLAAKSNEAGYRLMSDIKDRVVDRHYICLVHGVIKKDDGMIDAPIARNLKDRKVMSVRDGSGSRDAVTTFKVLERFYADGKDDGYTLLDCKLYTGRTHQIRVHMKFIKHAIVGDPDYGSGAKSIQLGLQRQFLHSYYLSCVHPINSTELTFYDNLPTDLSNALNLIKERTSGYTTYGRELLARLNGEW